MRSRNGVYPPSNNPGKEPVNSKPSRPLSVRNQFGPNHRPTRNLKQTIVPLNTHFVYWHTQDARRKPWKGRKLSIQTASRSPGPTIGSEVITKTTFRSLSGFPNSNSTLQRKGVPTRWKDRYIKVPWLIKNLATGQIPAYLTRQQLTRAQELPGWPQTGSRTHSSVYPLRLRGQGSLPKRLLDIVENQERQLEMPVDHRTTPETEITKGRINIFSQRWYWALNSTLGFYIFTSQRERVLIPSVNSNHILLFKFQVILFENGI